MKDLKLGFICMSKRSTDEWKVITRRANPGSNTGRHRSLNSARFKAIFSPAKHTVKSISKRINNLRNKDIKFAKRPPLACKLSWRKEVSAVAAPSLSGAGTASVCERKRRHGLD